MSPQTIGILHPGAMGSSIAASARNGGHLVRWASQGRSAATADRAARQGLDDAGSVETLCASCDVLLSVCPPHAAEALAQTVLGYGFTGMYMDLNAIAPQRARSIGAAMASADVAFVDGGIIGGPAWQPGQTWLYLAGPEAGVAAGYFAAGPLETRIVGDTIGSASALKMCYAAYSKGTTALLAALLAAAEHYAVRAELEQHWALEDAAFPAQAAGRVTQSSAKAWRFSGEMHEIAATFGAAGLPAEFHLAAAAVYDRLAQFKDTAPPPSLDALLAALLADGSAPTD